MPKNRLDNAADLTDHPEKNRPKRSAKSPRPSKLTAKEAIFCSCCAAGFDSRTAAIKAGYPVTRAEKNGMALMQRPDIQRQIKLQMEKGFSSRESLQHMAKQGLFRLAFGPVNDALTLLLGGEMTPEELLELDLFPISECKKTKDGFELKFADRIKALEKLHSLADPSGSGDQGKDFYDALERSAALLPTEHAATAPESREQDA